MKMTLTDITSSLACEVFTGSDQLKMPVEFGCASDLMSDVLAFSQSGALLLTGLVNIQTIQTAYIAEIKAIVFVRGKRPDNSIIALAKGKMIPLLGTQYSMYEACGILYKKGLIPTMAQLTCKL
ncbi:MAG: DRTGG domain-containing protein [Bacteroidota bacterium]|nr:DRTGG domain-containing protein [Bacteroidota bacterium]